MPERYLAKIQDYKALKERVRWAIGYVCDKYDQTNETIAKFLGYSTSTVNSYRRMVTLPGLEFFVLFLYKYGFQLDWFISGQGEPFPGARNEYPDVCGPEDEQPDHARHTEQPSVSEPPPSYTDNLSIADDLTKTARVLESKTSYATALHLNINSFHRAIEVEAKHSDINNRFDALQKRLSDVEKRNDELSREVIILRGQLLGGEDTSSGTG